MKRFLLRGRLASLASAPVILGLIFAAAMLVTGARAGVATSGAVLLDPFDPVPEIQFRHFGGYGGWGCNSGCGGGYCEDSCSRRSHCEHDCDRHSDCNDGCRRHSDCDRCGNDVRDAENAAPCTQGNCYDAEHYERRWRDGDRVGTEWFDRGRKEKLVQGGGRPRDWDGRDGDWHDEDFDNGGGPPHDHDAH